MSSFLQMKSPIGILTLEASDTAIEALHFEGQIENITLSTNDVLESAKQQLDEYFAGNRQIFTVPISFGGTDFQREVWKTLEQIPYGETLTYGEVATLVGRPRAARAVGGACHVNQLPIFIPCHRVIGQSGKLTGFADGLPTKIFLLELENAF